MTHEASIHQQCGTNAEGMLQGRYQGPAWSSRAIVYYGAWVPFKTCQRDTSVEENGIIIKKGDVRDQEESRIDDYAWVGAARQ